MIFGKLNCFNLNNLVIEIFIGIFKFVVNYKFLKKNILYICLLKLLLDFFLNLNECLDFDG